MKWLIIILVITLVGCELSPAYREMRAKERKEKWEGPCVEAVVKKDKLIHMACMNKDHKLVIEGEFVICRCPDKEQKK
ncbi:hypothetical protein LCGC14_0702120 [marine sediment metagenome]|uniref:Uncharacterized protein n=1 Tax=marine sediment metagenome TaxID=412755 RepID=A0A0F9QHJ4_9ZZZZ